MRTCSWLGVAVRFSTAGIAVLLLWLASPGRAAAQTPNFGAVTFVPMGCGASQLNDPDTDVSGGGDPRNIVGTNVDPALAMGEDAHFIYLRLRLDSSPLGGGNSPCIDLTSSGGWAWLINADASWNANHAKNFEAMVLVDKSTNRVQIFGNEANELDKPSDDPDVLSWATFPLVTPPTPGTTATRGYPYCDPGNVSTKYLVAAMDSTGWYIAVAVRRSEFLAAINGSLPAEHQLSSPLRGTFSMWAGSTANGTNLSVDLTCTGSSPAAAKLSETVSVSIPIGTTVTAPATGTTQAPTFTVSGTATRSTATTPNTMTVVLRSGITVKCTKGSIPVGTDGTWSVDTSGCGLLHGDAIGVTATAANGPADAISVTIATPAAIAVSEPATGTRIDTLTPTVRGTSDAVDGSAVTVSTGGNVTLCSTTVSSGMWSCVVGQGLLTDSTTVSLTATVAASGRAPGTDAVTGVMLDQLDVAITSPASAVATFTPTLAGTSDAPNGSTVAVSLPGPVALCSATVMGGSWQCIASGGVITSDGPLTTTATVTSNAAPGTTASASRAFAIDTTGPTLAISSPTHGSMLGTTTANISGTASDTTGVSSVSVTLTPSGGGAPVASGSASVTNGSWSFQATGLVNLTTYVVEVAGSDTLGNAAVPVGAHSFTINLAATNVAITAPLNGAVIGTATPAITGTSDAANGSPVAVRAGATALCNTTVSAGTWSCVVGAGVLTEGQPYAVVADVMPAMALAGSAGSAFTVDLTKPVLAITAPANGSTVTTSSPTLAGTVSDATSTPTVVVDSISPALSSPVANVSVTVVNGAWQLPLSGLADTQTYTASVTATDEAGNVQQVTSSFTVRTTTSVTISSPSAPTNDNTLTVTGTADPGAVVELFVDGVSEGMVTASMAGTWSIMVAAAVGDGTRALEARSAFLGLTAQATRSVLVDTISLVTIDTPLDGAPTPTFTGTSDRLASVALRIDGAAAGTVTANGSGVWTFSPPPLREGSHTLDAIATDPLGNPSAPASASFTTTNALALTIASPAHQSIIVGGTITVGGMVSSGPGVTSFTVDVIDSDGASIAQTASVPASAAWSLALPALDDGERYTVEAHATDAVGNEASAMTEFEWRASLSPILIVSPVPAAVTRLSTLVVQGTAEPDAHVSLQIGSGTAVTTTATASGTWQVSLPLQSDGTHIIQATSSFLTTSSSASVEVILDTHAAVAIDAPIEDNPLPTITGTADANSSLLLSIDGGATASLSADSLGLWSFVPATPLTRGAHAVRVDATDPVGNTATGSAGVTVSADLALAIIAPAPSATMTTSSVAIRGAASSPAGGPTAVVLSVVDDANNTVAASQMVPVEAGLWSYTLTGLSDGTTYTVSAAATDAAGNTRSVGRSFTARTVITPVSIEAPANGSAVSRTSLQVQGTAEPGASLRVYVADVYVRSVIAAVDGRFEASVVLPPSEALHALRAEADFFGVTSSASSSVRLDTSVMVGIDVPITDDPRPAVAGMTDPDAELVVALDGLTPDVVPVSTTGRWQFVPSAPLRRGTHTVTASATDALGNTATAIASFDVTADLSLTIVEPLNGSTIATSDVVIAGLTSSPAGGPTEVMLRVRGSGGAVVEEQTLPVVMGMWSYSLGGLQHGITYVLEVTGSDAAGNAATRGEHTFTVHSDIAPVVIASPAPETQLASTSLAVRGTGEPGATLDLFVGDAQASTLTIGPSGSWQAVVMLPSAEGFHEIRATSRSLGVSKTASVRVVLDVSVALTLELPIDDNPLPAIRGTTDPGSTLRISFDGRPAETITADVAGRFQLVPRVPLPSGMHTVSVNVTDPLGNAATQSATFAITTQLALAILAPVKGAIVTRTSVQLRGAAASAAGGVDSVRLTVLANGAALVAAQPVPVTAGSWSFDLTGLASGRYGIEVGATDAAGNTRTLTDYTFEVLLEVPVLDSEGDTVADPIECPAQPCRDTDRDSRPDYLDDDDDDDGVLTRIEVAQGDSDRDGSFNYLDDDDDDDGIPTRTELLSGDSDGNGVPDYLDDDDDGDGVRTRDEPVDADGDGVPDRLQPPAEPELSLQGGALCALAPASLGGGLNALLLVGLVGLTLRCRRRRRPAGRADRFVSSLLALACMSAGIARAQVALEQVKPAPLGEDGFALSRPTVLAHLAWSAQAVVDYARKPLELERSLRGTTSELPVVRDHLLLHAVGALGLADRFTLHLDLPVHAVMKSGTSEPLPGLAPDGAALGNLAIGARALLWGTDRTRFGLSSEFIARLPTAELARGEQRYAGDGVGSYEPALVGEVRSGRLDVRLRVGVRLRQPVVLGGLELGHELLVGVGARVRVARDVFLNGELVGSTFTAQAFERAATPLELLLGPKLRRGSLFTGLAGGIGLVRGFGSPSGRLLVTLGYASAPHGTKMARTTPTPAERRGLPSTSP